MGFVNPAIDTATLPSAAQRSSSSIVYFKDSLQLNEVKDGNNNFMFVLLFPAKYCQA